MDTQDRFQIDVLEDRIAPDLLNLGSLLGGTSVGAGVQASESANVGVSLLGINIGVNESASVGVGLGISL